jgi:hypothetical protein
MRLATRSAFHNHLISPELDLIDRAAHVLPARMRQIQFKLKKLNANLISLRRCVGDPLRG